MSQSKNRKDELNAIFNQLIEIPKGKIDLRDDRVKKQWTAEIESFLLSKFLVTQDLYYKITQKSPSSIKGKNKPIETVSWRDAIIFCNLLSSELNLEVCYTFESDSDEIHLNHLANGFRLPTEAEWEYACKCGTKDVLYGDLDNIAWYKNNSEKSTHEVGLKEPNSWGLYDMIGNVWEWCSDVYDETIYGSYRVFRGGGWFDEARSCLATISYK